MAFPYVAACLPMVALTLFAQSQSADWSNIQALSAGTEIRVALSASRAVRGQFESVTNDSLEINSGSGRQTFPRPQIMRVAVKKKGHRGRNILIGLGIGAGTGLAIGLASNNGFIPRSVLTAVVTSVLGAGGALVGAVMPSGGWRDIYRQ